MFIIKKESNNIPLGGNMYVTIHEIVPDPKHENGSLLVDVTRSKIEQLGLKKSLPGVILLSGGSSMDELMDSLCKYTGVYKRDIFIL